jgi:hypothetical protein
MVWDPSRIAPATWPSALALYRHIEDRNDDFRPLRQLVEHVSSRAYAASIFCATSGTSLLVAPRADVEWARESLRIDVDLSGAIRFVHLDPQLPKPQTSTCEGPTIVGAFERFLARSRWTGAPRGAVG